MLDFDGMRLTRHRSRTSLPLRCCHRFFSDMATSLADHFEITYLETLA
jgi:hypothetical protein